MADEGEEEPPPAIDGNYAERDPSTMPLSPRRRRLELRPMKSEGSSTGKRTKTHVDVDSSSSSSASCSYGDEEREAEAAGSGNGTPRLSHGAVSLMGRRREMEDAVTVAPGFASAEAGEGGVVLVPCAGPKTYDFFGVYDGHGGRKVAEACGERLHVVVAEEVAGGRAEGRWREAMASSFARLDGELAGADKWSEERTVGATAVVAVVGPRRIVVANCGDSRAVLSRGGIAVALSSDHKPDRPDEMERVEAAGGRVIEWDGYRILGVLATSRSIGDFYLKPFVTSEPEVTVTDRTEKDEFLILASDGLWDVVSNEAACHIARQCLNGQLARTFPDAVNGCTAADAAAILAELAMSRGSRDNISVVVVQLKQFGG